MFPENCKFAGRHQFQSMLQGYPTRSGTGIAIYGDYGDLRCLYDTVHHFAAAIDEGNKLQKGQHQLLMNFAYEIRHAYMGTRLKKKINFYDDIEEQSQYGFQLVWTDILIFISVLQDNAGYLKSDKLHQANLYMPKIYY